MATSSITKDFYVKDLNAYDKLKKDLEQKPVRAKVVKSASLQKGRDKLATFAFR